MAAEPPDNVLRTKILTEVNQEFHAGDNVTVALESDADPYLLTELFACFDEADETIRELASRAIIKVASTERGRMILCEDESGLLPAIRKLFDDKVVQIRANAYLAFIALAEFTYGVDQVIRQNIVAVLVKQLVEEKEETILVLILELLKILNEGEEAPVVIQSTEALAHLNKHLLSRNSRIREMAAVNLGSISYQAIGKSNCISAGSVQPLCDMLTDQVSEVRTAATRALCSMAQMKEGKVEIYDLDKLNEIIMLLEDTTEQTRLNTVQLICAVAEYPPAQAKFRECQPTLEELVTKEEKAAPLVSRFAQRAIDIITWKP